MKLLVAVLLVLLCSSSAAAQSPHLLRASFVTAIAAHGADLSTTAWCRGADTCHEANPALRWAEHNPAGLGFAKMGLAAALQLLPYKLSRSGHRLSAFCFNLAQTAAFSALAVRNARYAPSR